MSDETPKKTSGKVVRKQARTGLTAHFFVMAFGLVGLAVANRALTPDTLWVHWAAIVWGVVFLVHLAGFENETISTMDKKRRG